MPDRSEMSGSENEENFSEDEEMVNQELENLNNDCPSPSAQVGKQTLKVHACIFTGTVCTQIAIHVVKQI